MSTQINLQKKISVAKVFGQKITPALVIKNAGPLHVMRVLGAASGVKTGVSDFGEWEALTGQFRAYNPATGEAFDSGVLFMPSVALDLIAGQIRNGALGVEFAFDIYAVEDESSSVGYSYRATPIIQDTSESPVSRLEAKLALMIEAPKTKGEKAAEKAAKGQ